MSHLMRRFLLPALLALLPAVAAAGPITFVFSGTGTGTLNGENFSNQPYSLTFYSDTTQISDVGGVWETPLHVPGVFTVGSVSGTIDDVRVYIFANTGPYVHAVGIGNIGTSDNLDISDAALAGYGLVTSIGPISTNSPYLAMSGISTNLGYLGLSTATATFQAFAGGPETPTFDASTPEPTTALLGIPLLILLVKRRARG